MKFVITQKGIPLHTTNNIKQKVLASLQEESTPVDIDVLVDRVQISDPNVRAVDVKIAALDLVSKGEVTLTESWQFSIT